MTGPTRILIVDDDAVLRDAMTILLESEGHQVTHASDGRGALDELACGASFDVIILDLMMPVMDGATFLEHKSRSAYADIPVVVFSSSSLDGGRGSRVTVVPKLEGIEGLLAAIGSARRPEASPQPCPLTPS